MDVAAHVLAAEGWNDWDEYRELGSKLAEHGVLTHELGEALARMAGFRNLLVHEYAVIKPDRMRDYLPDSDAQIMDAAANDRTEASLIGAVGEAWTLARTTWQRADGLLPGPVLERVKRGDYQFTVVVLDAQRFRDRYSQRFWSASASNAERFSVEPETCGLHDRTTGTPPAFYFGYPFPAVDRHHEYAGCEIMWNVEAATAMAGGRTSTADADALGGDDDGRRVSMEMEWIAFLGRHFGPIANLGDVRVGPGSNPSTLRTASMIRVRGPAGVNGLGWLTWRPIDGSAPERTWMFAPALRRVRALSAAQRADGVAALAISIDDGSCFDGRLESFTWSVIGQQDILAPIVAATPLVLLRQRSAALDQDLRGDWFTVVTLTSH